MNDYGKTACPECGAVNGPGAPRCHSCGITLLRAGFAARPIDDDDEDEPPRKPVKKPAPDAVQKGVPPKRKPAPVDDEDEEERRPTKKVSRRDEDFEDEEERRPAKKRRRDEDDDVEIEEPAESIRDNPLLNMFFPVGVPLLAMGANYLGVLSILGVIFGGALAGVLGIKWVGVVLPALAAFMGFLAIITGGLSFIIRPKKTTYGSVTGYMRAIIGIVCGLIGLVGGPIVIFLLVKNM